MAGSVNKVIIVGNLGKDPEVKSFQNGGQICNFSVATSDEWKDKLTGEKKERTEWHNITLNSDGLISVAVRFLKKGSKVYIEGKLQTRKWQDQSGTDRYSTDIVVGGFDGKLVMLDGAKGSDTGNGGGGYKPPATGTNTGWGSPVDDLDDDSPFVSSDVRHERRVF